MGHPVLHPLISEINIHSMTTALQCPELPPEPQGGVTTLNHPGDVNTGICLGQGCGKTDAFFILITLSFTKNSAKLFIFWQILWYSMKASSINTRTTSLTTLRKRQAVPRSKFECTTTKMIQLPRIRTSIWGCLIFKYAQSNGRS